MLNVLSPFFHFWTSSCTVESHRFKESSRGKHNHRAMTTLYQLKLTANGRLTNMAASHALRRGHRMCWKQPTTCFLLLSYYEILYHKFIFVCRLLLIQIRRKILPFFSLSSDTLDSLLEHFVIVIDRCEHFSFSIQVAFLEVWKCDLSLFFLLNFENILFLSTWVSELNRN